jgi:hypothetical protein
MKRFGIKVFQGLDQTPSEYAEEQGALLQWSRISGNVNGRSFTSGEFWHIDLRRRKIGWGMMDDYLQAESRAKIHNLLGWMTSRSKPWIPYPLRHDHTSHSPRRFTKPMLL